MKQTLKFSSILYDLKFVRNLSGLLVFVICLGMIFSCSKDDKPVVELASVESVDPQSGFVGDTITINGNAFSTEILENVVNFNGTIAEIVEASSTTLKVKVPQNTTTGTLSLTVKEQEAITIGTFTVLSLNVFIFHDSEKKLAKVDLANGNITHLGNNIDYGSNSRGAGFHAINNEYIGFEVGFTGEPFLVRIDVENGSSTTTTIPGSFLTNGADFSDLVTDQSGNIYIFHDSEKKLAKIDVNTGNITYIGDNISYGENTRGAAICDNEYVGFENSVTDGPELVRINLSSGAVTYIPIPDAFLTNGTNFSDLAGDANGNIYIFHDSEQKLAKIDISTGNLTYIGNNIEYGENTRGAAIGRNEYIGFEMGSTYTPTLVKINLTNGSVTNLTIPASFLVSGSNFSDIAVGIN